MQNLFVSLVCLSGAGEIFHLCLYVILSAGEISHPCLYVILSVSEISHHQSEENIYPVSSSVGSFTIVQDDVK